MNEPFNLYHLAVLIACLIVGALFAWLLYGKTVHLDKKTRYALAGLRMVVVAAIAWLLFAPLIRNITYTLEKPIIIIGQDNSLSIDNVTARDFNKQKYQQDLQELSDQLSRQYQVKVYHFSDSVKTGFNFNNNGRFSNAMQFINQLNDELLNRNVGAVLLASDGIFNKGGSPLYDLNKLKAPVYTIALGDTIPKKDLMVANVNYNNLVFLDNEFTVEVLVQAFESKDELTTLSVLENGKKIKEEKLTIGAQAFVKTIPIKLKASKLGPQKYTIQLSAIENELSVRNNVQDIVIDVIDGRKKILLAANGPHPDIAALKQAISSNKHYELKVAFADELNALNIEDYSLVILYQLPAVQNGSAVFLNKLKQAKTSVWYILGMQTDLSGFNQQQKNVIYNGNSNVLQEAFSDVNAGFTAFDLDAQSAKVIAGFDPLLAPLGKPDVNANVSVVLNQRVGKLKTQLPQLFFNSSTERKEGYLIGEGLWRWRLSEAQDEPQSVVFNSLISKTVQYLAAEDDRRKFKVYTVKNTFDENEHVLINAVLYNDSYVAVNTPDVSIQIKNEAGKTYKFLCSRTETAYQLDAGMLPAGNYSYTATTKLGDKTYTANGIFYVNTIVAEYQQTIANHQLLNTMSVQTNGKMYLSKDLLHILKDIKNNEQIKTLSYEDRKYEELINFKWLFAMIMALLSLEWFIRKRNGEI